MNLKHISDEKRLCYIWWGAVALLFSFTYLLKPIIDPDFFWHLHTGQWIWEHGALPSSDPFATSTDTPVEPRQFFLLTSYWLAQVIYFVVYDTAGWSGIFVLRALLAILLGWALLARVRGYSLGYGILVASFLVVLVSKYNLERPQVFSWLCFALALVLLDRLAEQRDQQLKLWAAFGLPVVMVLWPQFHGGVLLGQILCVAHLLNNTFRCLSGQITKGYFYRVSTIVLVSLLATFVTPNWNNYIAIYQSFSDPKITNTFSFLQEYWPLHRVLLQNPANAYWFFPITAIVAIYGLLRSGVRSNLFHIILMACFGYYAFKHIRYLPFLGILALPFAYQAIAHFKLNTRLALLIPVFIACVSLSSLHFVAFSLLRSDGPVSLFFPQGAVSFIKQSGVRGNLWNDYNWGGYLRWVLGENHQVVIDSRTLDVERFNDYMLVEQVTAPESATKIDSLTKNQILNHMLRKYRIDYMILPKTYRGKPHGLTIAILGHSGWQLAYDDGMAVVFKKI